MPPRRRFSSTLEQQTLLYQLVRRYHRAKQNGALSEFWPVLWDLWFLQWPMVPEMIERGLLPPECANYKLTGEQTALLKAEKMPRLDFIQECMMEVYDAWLEVKLEGERRKGWKDLAAARRA